MDERSMGRLRRTCFSTLLATAQNWAAAATEAGRSGAHRVWRRSVDPAPEWPANPGRPHLTTPVRALVDLQLLTGARPGELLGLRAIDLEMDRRRGIWRDRPAEHKNAFREKKRIIYFGPRAQKVLKPFLQNRSTDAYLFSPREAEAERRAEVHARCVVPLHEGNNISTCRKARPRKQLGLRDTTPSYHRAVQSACERCFPPPEELRREEGERPQAWRSRLGHEK